MKDNVFNRAEIVARSMPIEDDMLDMLQCNNDIIATLIAHGTCAYLSKDLQKFLLANGPDAYLQFVQFSVKIGAILAATKLLEDMGIDHDEPETKEEQWIQIARSVETIAKAKQERERRLAERLNTTPSEADSEPDYPDEVPPAVKDLLSKWGLSASDIQIIEVR